MLIFVYVLFLGHLSRAGTIPAIYNTLSTSVKTQSRSIGIPDNALPITSIQVSPITSVRKKRSPKIPLTLHHQLLVPNLHVIPIQHHIHSDLNHIITNNKVTVVGQNVHGTNSSHTLIPVLIPIHNLVPVHDLTVIPLHRVDKISFNDRDEIDRYRNPLGGYGAGWSYGGHGAGHGFHYAYG